MSAFKKNHSNFFFALLFAVSSIGISFSIFNINIVSSLCFYLTFVIIFVWLVYVFYKLFLEFKSDQNAFVTFKNNNILFLILFIAILSFFNIILKTPLKSYSFSYLRRYLISFGIIFYIYLTTKVKFEKRCPIFIFVIPFVFVFLLAISYFSGIGKLYANQSSKNLLKFTFGNPNGAGLVFSIIILLCIYFGFKVKNIALKISYFIISLFPLYLLYLTKSRNCIIGLFLSFALFLVLIIDRKYSEKLFLKKRIVLFIVLLPLIISVFYVILICGLKADSIINLLFGSKGKEVSSRSLSWISGYKLFASSFVFGNYYNATVASLSGILGYQNMAIDLLVAFGIFPSISIFIYYYLHLFNVYKDINLKNNFIFILALSFFAFNFFSGTFESGMFIGVGSIYIFSFSFIALSCDKKIEDDNDYPSEEKVFFEIII